MHLHSLFLFWCLGARRLRQAPCLQGTIFVVFVGQNEKNSENMLLRQEIFLVLQGKVR